MISHTWLSTPQGYTDMLRQQEQHVTLLREKQEQEHLYLLEHTSVYTIGRTRDKSSLLSPESLPHPVIEISRGGQATYHGPGQLVGYPIIDLNTRKKDLHLYIRALEQSLIDLCSDFSVMATQREGMTGVWVEERKLASIGVGVRRWITLHGFAINITRESLPPFLSITPCGLAGVSMTCLAREAQRKISTEEAALAYVPHFQKALETLGTGL